MNLAEIVEVADRTPGRRNLYAAVLLAALGILIALRAAEHGGLFGKPSQSDFDIFYMASKLVWQGELGRAYDAAAFGDYQLATLGSNYHMAWTYPPPYALVVAPLSALPLPLSFAAFFAVTAAAYLWTLLRLAGEHRVTVLLLTFINLYGVVIFGQNGLLTGALIGLASLALLDRRGVAGVPLGLMVIKPHLAIGLAFHVLVTRQWRVVAIAAATVLVAIGMATAAFGIGIWPAFLSGARETGSALAGGGRFPLYRMVSPFAALASLGAPTGLALAGQAVSAVAALAVIAVAARRMAVREALGVATIAGLLVPPYVYDYDLPILGIGLALVMPELVRRGRPGERSLVYALVLFVSTFGLVMTARHNLNGGDEPATIAGLALIIVLAVTVRVLLRPAPATTSAGPATSVEAAA